jgi:pyrroline-5-carboxylate reductase
MGAASGLPAAPATSFVAQDTAGTARMSSETAQSFLK